MTSILNPDGVIAVSTKGHPILDPEGTLRARADAIKADFLENRWDRYMAMVRRLEAHPENREGADKTWVAQAKGQYQRHFRHAARV